MINKNHVIGVLATVIFIDEVIIAQINRSRMSRLKRAVMAAEEKATYFAEMLDKHEVPINEFDKIAINSFYDKV